MASALTLWIFGGLAAAGIVWNVGRRFCRETRGIASRKNPVDYWFHRSEGVSAADVLATWGRGSGAQNQNLDLIRNKDLQMFLGRYDRIGPDEYLRVVDSSLFQTYEPNPEFFQIGEWGDGSRVLIHNVEDDAQVYIADFEESPPELPTVLASTMERYLVGAWEYNRDASR